MDLTPREDQKCSEEPKIPREVYEAARSAMQQREAVPGRPECGPYPATLDELAESIVDAIWPLAYRAGREDAAKAIEAERDRWESLGYDDSGAWVAAVRLARGQHTQDGGER